MDGSVLKDRLGHQFASAEEIFQILNSCKTVFYDCEIKIKTKFRIFFLFIALKIPESILMKRAADYSSENSFQSEDTNKCTDCIRWGVLHCTL